VFDDDPAVNAALWFVYVLAIVAVCVF